MITKLITKLLLIINPQLNVTNPDFEVVLKFVFLIPAWLLLPMPFGLTYDQQEQQQATKIRHMLDQNFEALENMCKEYLIRHTIVVDAIKRDQTATDGSIKRIIALYKQGKISKANQAAQQQFKHADLDHPTTRQQFIDLFPQSNLPAHITIGDIESFTDKEVKQTIMDNKSTGAGPSGWRASHLQFLCNNEAINAVQTIVNLFVKGIIPDQARPYITTAVATLAVKPNGTIRPISVMEIFIRISGQMIQKYDIDYKITDNIPYQYFNSIGGCQAIVHMVNSKMRTSPEKATLLLDLTNAYGNANRYRCVERLKAMNAHPRILNYFNMLYTRSIKIITNSYLVANCTTGFLQGDPLASLFFCVTISELLKEIKQIIENDDGLIFALMDDITVITTPTKIQAVMEHLQHENQKIRFGLQINMSKTKTFPFSTNTPSLRVVKDVSQSTEGVKLLGAYIGTDEYVKTQCTIEANQTKNMLDNISILPSQIALAIARLCIAPRLEYLASLTSSVLFADAAKIHDQHMQNFVQSLANKGVENVITMKEQLSNAFTLTHLPFEMAGIGIPSLNWRHELLYINSLQQAMKLSKFAKRTIEKSLYNMNNTEQVNIKIKHIHAQAKMMDLDTSMYLTTIQDMALAERPRFIDYASETVSAFKLWTWKKRMKSLMDSTDHNNITMQKSADAAMTYQRLVARSHKIPGIAAPLYTIASDKAFVIHDKEFGVMLRLLLMLPCLPSGANGKRCMKCKQTTLTEHHIISCSGSYSAGIRHNKLRDAIINYARQHRIHIKPEPLIPGSQKRADMLIPMGTFDGQDKTLLFDVFIVDPTKQASLFKEEWHALNKTAQKKHDMYLPLMVKHQEGLLFMAIGIECYGGISPAFDSFLKALATSIEDKSDATVQMKRNWTTPTHLTALRALVTITALSWTSRSIRRALSLSMHYDDE